MDDLLKNNQGSISPVGGTIVRCRRCFKLNRITSSVVDRIPMCGSCKARLRQRRVITCDVSASMNESAGSQRKIDVLREALSTIVNDTKDCTIFAFASYAKLVENPDELPQPSGGTALHLALRAASSLDPESVLVISDGHPDSSELAFSSAALLPGRIDVLYIGPDDDKEAKSFMLALARTHCGVVIERDLLQVKDAPKALAQDVKLLLENRNKR
jgi:hypothetical protein